VRRRGGNFKVEIGVEVGNRYWVQNRGFKKVRKNRG
jgi:hypothetical protein